MANIFQRAATSIFNGIKKVGNAFLGGNKPDAQSAANKPSTTAAPALGEELAIIKLKALAQHLGALRNEGPFKEEGVFRKSPENKFLGIAASDPSNDKISNYNALDTAAILKQVVRDNLRDVILPQDVQEKLGQIDRKLDKAETKKAVKAILDNVQDRELLNLVTTSALTALDPEPLNKAETGTKMDLRALGVVIGPNILGSLLDTQEKAMNNAVVFVPLIAESLLALRQEELDLEAKKQVAINSSKTPSVETDWLKGDRDPQGRDPYDDDYMKEELPSAVAGESEVDHEKKDGLSLEFKSFLEKRASSEPTAEQRKQDFDNYLKNIEKYAGEEGDLEDLAWQAENFPEKEAPKVVTAPKKDEVFDLALALQNQIAKMKLDSAFRDSKTTPEKKDAAAIDSESVAVGENAMDIINKRVEDRAQSKEQKPSASPSKKDTLPLDTSKDLQQGNSAGG